jgi:hypothetical protein
MTKNESNQRQNAYTILYGSLVAIVCFVVLFISVLPKEVAGMPVRSIIPVIALFVWMYVLTKFIPRCPNCGLGLFSIIEIGRVPVVLKSWVGNQCPGCGKERE